MKQLTFALAVTAAVALSACGRDAHEGPTASGTSRSSSAETSSVATAPSTSPSTAPSTDQTTAQGSPTGSGTPSAASNTAVMGAAADTGQATYTKTCAMCHAAGVAGAPKPGDKADWGPRAAQGKDVLYTHALQGFTGKKGQMPPKGGNTALADADVKAAVDYMVNQSK